MPSGAITVMIVWSLDLQLPMQSVPITTDLVSLNLDQGEVYSPFDQPKTGLKN